MSSEYLKRLTLTPKLKSVLGALRAAGVILVLLSTHPQNRVVADAILNEKADHFGLVQRFDIVSATPDDPHAKGARILEILKRLKIPKSRALMVGDSYRYDYNSATEVGVEAVLIKSEYMRQPRRGPRIRRTIAELSEIWKFVRVRES